MKAAILAVAGAESCVDELLDALTKKGHTIDRITSATDAQSRAQANTFDVAFIEDQILDETGLQYLDQLSQIAPHMKIIVLSGNGSVAAAVQVMRRGAFSYLTSPLKVAEVVKEITAACEKTHQDRSDIPATLLSEGTPRILGASQAIQELLVRIRKMALCDERVLIEGESGTGKELVARELHLASGRASGPFVAFNCAAIQESLLESELFGHEKGAFTTAVAAKPGLFELANEGTLFIDEIGEMRLELQAKLLRVLEDGRVRRVGGTTWIQTNVRVLSATNKDIAAEVQDNRFRQDLYYRLSVLTLKIPPIRERREDIPILVRHFLAMDETGPHEAEANAMESLQNHDWPGNVRELENVIKRAKVLAEGPRVTIRDLPDETVHPPNQSSNSSTTELARSATHLSAPAPNVPANGKGLDEYEKQHVLSALNKEHWNKSRTAQHLGISRHRLYRLIAKHDLKPSQD